MFKKFRPIPWEEFPTDKKTVDQTNCLAFALGIKEPKRRKHQYSLLMTGEPIATIFRKKVKELGFNPKKFKRVSRLQEEKEKGCIIRIYGFIPEETIDEGIKDDFHVIRREKDGKWVHKPGFFFKPKEISHEDWDLIFEKYGNTFISFAVETE